MIRAVVDLNVVISAVITSAYLGKAEYLVTGDRGLLDLGRHEQVAILSPRAFLGLLPIG